jgi:hypothetical protein
VQTLTDKQLYAFIQALYRALNFRIEDGRGRDVYEDAEGRQYVHDDDGVKLYGTWMMPADCRHIPDGRLVEAAYLVRQHRRELRGGQVCRRDQR